MLNRQYQAGWNVPNKIRWKSILTYFALYFKFWRYFLWSFISYKQQLFYFLCCFTLVCIISRYHSSFFIFFFTSSFHRFLSNFRQIHLTHPPLPPALPPPTLPLPHLINGQNLLSMTKFFNLVDLVMMLPSSAGRGDGGSPRGGLVQSMQ